MHGGTDWTCEPDSGSFIPRCSMMFRNNMYGNQCANMQANKQTTMLFLVWHFDISGFIRGIPRFNIFESLNEMIHQNNSNSPTHGHCSNIVTSPDLTEAVKPRSPKVIKLPPARPAPRPSARPVEPPSLEQRRLRWKTMGRKDGNIWTLVTLGWKFLRQTSDLQDMLTLFETSNRCWLFFWRQDLLLHWKVLRSGRISWKNLLLV